MGYVLSSILQLERVLLLQDHTLVWLSTLLCLSVSSASFVLRILQSKAEDHESASEAEREVHSQDMFAPLIEAANPKIKAR
jgi:hypothetical protein